MFTLDYRSGLPIYEQLYQSITRMAALGGISPGESLPSVRALAQELGVNPNTVQKAYQMLERDGVICCVPGKGSFISDNSSASFRQKQMAIKKLEEAVKSACGCGAKKEEIIEHVRKILSSEGEDVS